MIFGEKIENQNNRLEKRSILMKKSILILALCFVLMFAVSAVSADETAGHKVTYLPNNCLAEVPVDDKYFLFLDGQGNRDIYAEE